MTSETELVTHVLVLSTLTRQGPLHLPRTQPLAVPSPVSSPPPPGCPSPTHLNGALTTPDPVQTKGLLIRAHSLPPLHARRGGRGAETSQSLREKQQHSVASRCESSRPEVARGHWRSTAFGGSSGQLVRRTRAWRPSPGWHRAEVPVGRT